MARIKALFRRVEAMQVAGKQQQNNHNEHLHSDKTIRIRDIEINILARTVKVLGEAITLTAKEFDLLYFFAQHPGQVFTRTQLLDKVWGYGHDGYEHTVNSHINRLRAKVESKPAQPDYILTAWGVGYKFTEDV
ncbi:MAG: response regulator transcription factor [gamma proteobacterium symbiont of Lucinoma myriamae]|nr:response regulator transcription factor [gamma proteobacterium symbiont of Lucinoma myriamae]MCU7833416.1 response regulator transcription factor [gamma proteobacterium symbiont of Lucinoma myriamae]